MEGRIAAGVSRTLKGLEPMQNISLLLLGHECLVQREFLEQSCATPRPRLEKMGIPARRKASKSLWMVLTETEQYSASSFAVPHEPLMSKKTIWKRRSTCMEKLLKRSPPPQKLCGGPRRGIFQKARGLAWNSFPKGPLQ